jgi:hypothetical protein
MWQMDARYLISIWILTWNPCQELDARTHVQQAQNFVFRKLTPSQIHIVTEKWDSCVQYKTLCLETHLMNECEA